MKRNTLLKCNILAFLVAAGLATAPVLADKPSRSGDEKGENSKQKSRKDSHSKHDRNKHESSGREERDEGRHEYFDDKRRTVIHEYYTEQFRTGRCPPGLAKKNNGCMPPGQVRKWKKGYPLPHDVVYYDLPTTVVAQIGPPPSGHRYVRVAGDILLMAIGTGMIVDALEDLSR